MYGLLLYQHSTPYLLSVGYGLISAIGMGISTQAVPARASQFNVGAAAQEAALLQGLGSRASHSTVAKSK
ncbi:MAG: hypothetical protein IPG83_11145 [Novosphingobium sp.]|nr:hypothetical protein [Novosphingobium sp.]